MSASEYMQQRQCEYQACDPKATMQTTEFYNLESQRLSIKMHPVPSNARSTFHAIGARSHRHAMFSTRRRGHIRRPRRSRRPIYPILRSSRLRKVLILHPSMGSEFAFPSSLSVIGYEWMLVRWGGRWGRREEEDIRRTGMVPVRTRARLRRRY